MRNTRQKQKNIKRRKIISQEQLAQDKLIQISVMPDAEVQINESDLFVQKMEPKYSLRTQQSINKPKSAVKRRQIYTSMSEHFPKKTANDWYHSKLEDERMFNFKNTLNVAKIPIICSKQHMIPKNSLSFDSVDRPRSKQSRGRSRLYFSCSSFKIQEKCQSMRTRLKKGINTKVIEAFQVQNIPLRHKFDKYLRQYESFKQL